MRHFFKLLICIYLIIFAPLVYAETIINSLPYQCNTDGETYILNSNLTASNDAIIISANNIVINGNNHTITYAQSSSGDGIAISGSYNGLEVYNLTLNEGVYGGSAFDNRNYSPTNVSLHDLIINGNTVADIAIKFNNFTSDINVSIVNNHLNIQPTSGNTGDGIAFDSSSGAEVFGNIEGNTIDIGGSLSSSRPAAVNLSNAGGNLLISSNNISLSGPDDNNAILLWDSSGHEILSNDISMNCDHCRGILIDGGSDNNTISANNIDMNTSGSCSGIRVRFGSDNNIFTSNNVDSTDASNGYALRHGERQDSNPSDYPDSNVYNDNNFIGISPVIKIENGSDNTKFSKNTVTSTNGGYCIDFIIWSGYDPNAITNMSLKNEVYNTASSYKACFRANSDQADQFSNIVWCGSNIESSEVYNPQGITGWSVSNSAECDNQIPIPPPARLSIH